jgi:hypothetical protein
MKHWSHQDQLATINLANSLLGVLLVFSPWLLGSPALWVPEESTAALNAAITGMLIAGVSLAPFVERESWQAWAALTFGAWATVSPWIAGFESVAYARWTHLALGAAVALLAGMALWRSYTAPPVEARADLPHSTPNSSGEKI